MHSNVIVSVTISCGSFVFPCLLLDLSLSLTLVSKRRKYVPLVSKYVTTLTEPNNRHWDQFTKSNALTARLPTYW